MRATSLLAPEALLLVGGRSRSSASGCRAATAGLRGVAPRARWPRPRSPRRAVADRSFGGMLASTATRGSLDVGIAVLAAFGSCGRGAAGWAGRARRSLCRSSRLRAPCSWSARRISSRSYMALELSTMPAYVLMGYRRAPVAGLEGALKYFLLSLLTSLIMLYGLSFVYGVTGSTRLSEI